MESVYICVRNFSLCRVRSAPRCAGRTLNSSLRCSLRYSRKRWSDPRVLFVNFCFFEYLVQAASNVLVSTRHLRVSCKLLSVQERFYTRGEKCCARVFAQNMLHGKTPLTPCRRIQFEKTLFVWKNKSFQQNALDFNLNVLKITKKMC